MPRCSAIVRGPKGACVLRFLSKMTCEPGKNVGYVFCWFVDCIQIQGKKKFNTLTLIRFNPFFSISFRCSIVSYQTELNYWCCHWPLIMNNSGKSLNFSVAVIHTSIIIRPNYITLFKCCRTVNSLSLRARSSCPP